MLKKIEGVTIRVNDVAEAANFYSDVFGLKLLWRDEQEDSAGLLFPDAETTLVLSYDARPPGQAEIHYLVDDVVSAVQKYTDQGCSVLVAPLETRVGWRALIQDPFGVRFFLLDTSRSVAELEVL